MKDVSCVTWERVVRDTPSSAELDAREDMHTTKDTIRRLPRGDALLTVHMKCIYIRSFLTVPWRFTVTEAVLGRQVEVVADWKGLIKESVQSAVQRHGRMS